jgi:hypothetical protein
MMIGYMPLPRRCTDCGEPDPTLLIGGVCRKCFGETTRIPVVKQPPTPRLDAHIARVEARAAREASCR